MSGTRGEADLELPDDAPLATLLAALARSYTGVDLDQVVVMVAGRGRLDVGRSLAESGVRPGAVLNLFPGDLVPMGPPSVAERAVGAAAAPASAGAVAVAVAGAGRTTATAVGAPRPKLRLVETRPERGPEPGRWAWQGAHGGAGVTTLARALGGLEATRQSAGSLPRIVVARTHATGLEAAQRLAAELDAAEVAGAAPVLGLVLVPDAPGRLPPALQDLAHVVVGGYPRWWALRWSAELRFGGYRKGALPRRVRRLGEDLHALALGQSEEQRRVP